ncbi:hypothetical protein [Mycolicibacterium septicum]|uniref:hypothetical protein n=1 Tax=Mycolicibacterium septicum TaxID=98668 RepID=UPI001AF1E288|nr:hypothetical protein [Mycolicibacterium septicum]QRY53843.1 hypothetical protein JVX95_11280 [Mycolicibacterium septicum]
MQVSGEADWMFWVGAAIVLVGVGNGIFLSNRRLERRIYWLCWVAGGLVMVLATRAQNPDRALGLVGFSVAMATMMAFFRTPYLKIGNTIYAISGGDRKPDPPEEDGVTDGSYGRLRAPTVWWLLAIFVGAGAYVVWDEGWAAMPSVAAGIFTLCTAMTGFVDITGDFSRFRRQYVPAAVLAVASIPLYCAPPLLYLLCYEIGRWLKADGSRTHPN